MSKDYKISPQGLPLTLEQANELIYKLLDRIAELEDRLNQNRGNSSRPPSSDVSGKPSPSRKRSAGGRKRGAQPEHKEWLRAVISACIEKTDYPIPEELLLSMPSV